MTRDELEKFINDLVDKIKNTKDSDIIEVYFLKIFVKFQCYLTDVFINYALGEKSEKGYCPIRKLNFPDRDTMERFLKMGNKRYIDYYDLAKTTGDIFFVDNPFNIMNQTTNFKMSLQQMESIRNYIAHESEESKRSYLRYCLFDSKFIRPSDFLLKINNSNNYSNLYTFIEDMKNISDLILEKSLV